MVETWCGGGLIMDLLICEATLNEYIEMTSIGGDLEHKGVHNLLKDFAMLGYLFRSNHTITLLNGKVNSEDEEDYQKYLDLKASGMQPDNWEDMEHD